MAAVLLIKDWDWNRKKFNWHCAEIYSNQQLSLKQQSCKTKHSDGISLSQHPSNTRITCFPSSPLAQTALHFGAFLWSPVSSRLSRGLGIRQEMTTHPGIFDLASWVHEMAVGQGIWGNPCSLGCYFCIWREQWWCVSAGTFTKFLTFTVVYCQTQ